MMSGYVFVENSNKPTEEEAKNRNPIRLDNVSIPCLLAAKKLGFNVYLGVNRDNPETIECDFPVNLYDSHTYRSITAFRDNKIAFRNLERLVKEKDIQVIHCNTPVGGLVGRLVGKRIHVPRVIYTAHGFHFYKGAPLINRTIFKWAEQIMAHWTDAIITMNQEDYEAAKRFKLKKGGKVFKVHGVGINTEEYFFNPELREKKRKELAVEKDGFVIVSAGDLIERKNYGVAITAIAKCNNDRINYYICGRGPEETALRELAKSLGVEKQIHFLGFRSDVKDILSAADAFLFTTLQEGMPRSLMEAMAIGLPCIVSKIRGNVDLITDGVNGYLCPPLDSEFFAKRINDLVNDYQLRKRMGMENLDIIKSYDVKAVCREIYSIYADILK